MLDRRALLGTAAAAPAVAAAQTPTPTPTPNAPVTAILARYVAQARFEDLPANVRKEAARSFLNWVGVTVGGSREAAVTNCIAALSPFAGKPEANLLGRSERLDSVNAGVARCYHAPRSILQTIYIPFIISIIDQFQHP